MSYWREMKGEKEIKKREGRKGQGKERLIKKIDCLELWSANGYGRERKGIEQGSHLASIFEQESIEVGNIWKDKLYCEIVLKCGLERGYRSDVIEVGFVDGGHESGTRDIKKEYSGDYQQIRCIKQRWICLSNEVYIPLT